MNFLKFIRKFKAGIKNLISWFPIVWNDRNWDQHFFFKVLKFKLKNMENYFRYYAHFVGDKKEADQIKICIMLLDRIVEEEYHNTAFKFHDEKWGELKMKVGESGYLTSKYANVKTKKDKINQEKEFKRCTDLENYLQKQDVDYLFKLIRRNIWKWWD